MRWVLAALALLRWVVSEISTQLRVRSAEKAVRTEARAETAEAYIETRERIDHADVVGDDPAAARRWLRERARRGTAPKG